MSRRTVAWGVAAGLLYLVAAVLVSRVMPVRILYEGEAPPVPYRWVVPPPPLAGTNVAPQAGTGTVPVGAQPGQVITGDGQAVVVFPEGSISPRQGESQADVKITPLDPGTIAPPPLGMRIDGNAYQIEAVYLVSKAPVVLSKPATIVLRYPVHATDLLRYSAGWASLRGQAVQATLQVFASTNQLGVFVAAASGTPRLRSLWWGYIFAAVGLVVWLIATILIGLRTASQDHTARRRISRNRS